MRSLVIDFEWTVLGPAILFGLVVLASFVYEYRSAKGNGNHQQAYIIRNLMTFMVVGLLVLSSGFLVPDRFKMFFAYQIWGLLGVVSGLSVFIATVLAWYFAKKYELLKVAACLLSVLMGAASTEHCYHQRINSQHVVCPDCNDDDERPNEDSRILWRDIRHGGRMVSEDAIYVIEHRGFRTRSTQQG